jgi:hypothetical protein
MLCLLLALLVSFLSGCNQAPSPEAKRSWEILQSGKLWDILVLDKNTREDTPRYAIFINNKCSQKNRGFCDLLCLEGTKGVSYTKRCIFTINNTNAVRVIQFSTPQWKAILELYRSMDSEKSPGMNKDDLVRRINTYADIGNVERNLCPPPWSVDGHCTTQR